MYPHLEPVKGKILSAALLRFSHQGVDHTYMRDIAKDAGVRESTIYYHFDGKEGILAALGDACDRRRQQAFEDFFMHSLTTLFSEATIDRAWLLGQLDQYIDFFVNIEDARYAHVVNREKFARPSLAQGNAYRTLVWPRRLIAMFLETLKAGGMVANDINVPILSDISAHTVRSIYRTYFSLPPVTEEILAACRLEVRDRAYFIADNFLLTDQADVTEELLITYALYGGQVEPALMPRIDSLFEDTDMTAGYANANKHFKVENPIVDKALAYFDAAQGKSKEPEKRP